jgi:hypothetical protein
MKIVNLNKHVIVVLFAGVETKYEPSGMVASVEVKQTIGAEVNGIPCVKNEYGEVVGLPAPENDTLYLVNAIVLERAKSAMGRRDCIAPDTGPTAIRDKGQVIAVVRFVM